MPHDDFGWIAPLYARSGEYGSSDFLRDLAGLPVAGRLLDAGGGTGRVAEALHGQAGRIVVADLSRHMLHYAARRPVLAAVAAQTERLPFPDETFECVIMVDALHHVVDQAATAGELFRVLKAGGRLVIEEPDIRTWGVKLIALGERLLFMRSHFLDAEQIAGLFSPSKNFLREQDGSVWVVVEK